jgi:predicted esterase
VERLRQIISLQRRLRDLTASPRAQQSLTHRGIFREALTWMEIHGDSQEVVASWMTRQDRELAIADNLAYVASVVDAEWIARQGTGGVVFSGFSQGVAMAFRAAAASTRRVAGVIAVGGDVPPELDRAALSTLGRALVCRGARDKWYSAETFAQDQARLRDARVAVTPHEYDGAHEWSAPVLHAASAFLQELAV